MDIFTPAEVKAYEDAPKRPPLRPEQLLDNMCNRILNFALDHGLTAEELKEVFDGGIAAAHNLRPDLSQKMKVRVR